MEKLNIQPSKKEAKFVSDKIAAGLEISEYEKAVLFSYFSEYCKDEKNEMTYLKKLTKFLPRKKENIYTLQYFHVVDGFVLLTNGHFLVKVKTSLPAGVYDRNLNMVDIENFEYPEIERIITVCESYTARCDITTSVENFSDGPIKKLLYFHCDNDVLAAIDNEYSSLFDMSKVLFFSEKRPDNSPIMQKLPYGGCIIIMPIQL